MEGKYPEHDKFNQYDKVWLDGVRQFAAFIHEHMDLEIVRWDGDYSTAVRVFDVVNEFIGVDERILEQERVQMLEDFRTMEVSVKRTSDSN